MDLKKLARVKDSQKSNERTRIKDSEEGVNLTFDEAFGLATFFDVFGQFNAIELIRNEYKNDDVTEYFKSALYKLIQVGLD